MCLRHGFRVAFTLFCPRRFIPGWLSASLAFWSVFGAGNSAFAVVGTWSSTATTGAWQTSANWVSGIVPGATSGTTNIDLAEFNSSSSTTTIVNDAGRNLESIEFDTSAAAYTIGTTGGNSLVLTANGEIFIASTFSGSHVPESINAPLTLEGSYTFADNDPTHTDLLGLGGAITSGTAGTQTLKVAGNADTQINGAIGGGTGTIALQMNGTSTGRLFLGGNNTFTGGVTISSGTIVLDNPNALGSTAASVAVASGATLDLGQQFVNAAPPLTIQGTGVGGLGALVTSSFASYSGAINSNVSNSFSVGGIGPITLSGGFNNIGGNSTLTYVGSSVLTFSGTANNSILSLTVNSGTVVLAKASSPTVHAVGNSVVINGGLVQLAGTGGDQIADNSFVEVNGSSATFDTNGQSETIFALDLFGTGINGAGALVNSANATSVLTPNFTALFSDTTIGVPQVGGSLTLNSGIFNNTTFVGGNHGITKVGQGTLILTGNDSSPGVINVNAGTLVLNGGSVAGDVVNAATFVYAGTGFGGRLTNTGIATINVDFGPGNGMENDGVVSIAPGVNLALNGAGLLNSGSFSMTGGTLTLSPSGTNTNSGAISLSSAARLNLAGASITNTGVLSLDGALVNGAGGTLTNAAGGYISGTGTISTSFSNGGLLTVGSGAMTVTQAFTNSGAIQLTAFNSTLTGGTVMNTGSVQGLGNIGNAVTNTGTIEPIGGTLFVSGTLLNPAGGLIRVSTGNKLLVTHGLLASAGIVNLTGGTFDNNGQPMNNLGQISGWGTFATGGTGLDNNGSITLTGGTTAVNGALTNENGKTIVVAYNPAIFTGLVTNNGGATFNIVSTTAVFAGGSSGAFNGTFTNNVAGAFNKSGSGTLEIDGPPTLGNSSSINVNDTGTLRFKALTGTATIGTGVTAHVNDSGTLELAGSVSALSNGSNRVNIINNSSAAAGLLISGKGQQVGNIDGSGATQVKAGSDLTANHIIQSALVIGGTESSPGLVTIDASDSSGNPLDSALGGPLGQSNGFAPASSLQSSAPFASGAPSSSSSDPPSAEGFSGDPIPAGPGADGVGAGGNPSAVPEPSTLVLALLAVIGAVVKTRGAGAMLTRASNDPDNSNGFDRSREHVVRRIDRKACPRRAVDMAPCATPPTF
jgi:fibronectin-binding autotransporter adhesin